MKLKSVAIVFLSIAGILTIVSRAQPDMTRNLIESSVMIVNLEENRGGSGVILKSTPSASYVLTNGHVCRAVEGGGVVKTYDHETHLIMSAVQATNHDLCLITVMADLKANTRVADTAAPLGAKAYISGHPTLLPTIITTGHFAGRKLISVGEPDPSCGGGIFAFLCPPKVKLYETEVVSATISPGSSGSGVFNERGELSGLVFAGRGDLGYAMTVPLEFISMFLLTELKTLALAQ